MSPTFADNTGQNSQYPNNGSPFDFRHASRLPAAAGTEKPGGLFPCRPIAGKGGA